MKTISSILLFCISHFFAQSRSQSQSQSLSLSLCALSRRRRDEKNARGRGEDGGEEKVRLFRLNGRLFDRFDEEERREAVAAGGDVDERERRRRRAGLTDDGETKVEQRTTRRESEDYGDAVESDGDG